MTEVQHEYERIVAERFGGLLRIGKHTPNGEACAMEAASIAKNLKWTDSPIDVGLPDIRRINDAYLNDKARTSAIVPLVVALWNWSEWSKVRHMAWAKIVALRTIREILPLALKARVAPELLRACCDATDLDSARIAARNVSAAAAYAYAAAAYAYDAADDAADDAAARHQVLDLACRIWTEAAKETE